MGRSIPGRIAAVPARRADIQVEPVAGGYLYYEEKSWRENGGRAHFDSVGAGMEVGALLHPFTYAAGSDLDLAFYPFLRYGLGTSGGRFRDVPIMTDMGPGFSRGDFGDFRVEAGLGADLRVVFGSRVTLAGGIGITWWDSLDTALIEIRDGAGTVLIDEDETRFDGRDTYFRITLGHCLLTLVPTHAFPHA